jgi:copper resistance protein B
MQMDDTSAFSMLRFNSFEWRSADSEDSLSWDAQAWYGTDYNKLWLKSEGDRAGGQTDARTEVLWDRIFARWWNVQAGVRHDLGEGTARTWAAFGVQGIAPYFFEVEATAYVGEAGRTALRFSGDYELLLTQRLILQSELELNVFGKNDPRNRIGSGVSDTELALRLRYEFRREFAPYVGVAWTQRYGNTADLARAARRDVSEVQWLAGVCWWF